MLIDIQILEKVWPNFSMISFSSNLNQFRLYNDSKVLPTIEKNVKYRFIFKTKRSFELKKEILLGWNNILTYICKNYKKNMD
jgi:hypothetical protein